MKNINRIWLLIIGTLLFIISYKLDNQVNLLFTGLRFPLLDVVFCFITIFYFFNFGYFSIHNQVNCAKAEAIGSISLSNKAAYLPAHQHTCLFFSKYACNGCFFIAARNNKIFAKTEIFLDYICFFGCVQQGLFWISFLE